MIGDPWTCPVAFAAALIATVSTPAGVSGAVLLLPFQVRVLGTPSPAVTPTNLLYNFVATAGALDRFWRQGQTSGIRMQYRTPGSNQHKCQSICVRRAGGLKLL